MRIYVVGLVLLNCVLVCAEGQDLPPRGRKPVLVRDEVNKEVDEAPPVPVHDPEQARRSVEIGDFYFKRGNFEAAKERYEEAIAFNKRWPESYKKLIKALEKMEQFEAGLEVCDRFAEENPASSESSSFAKLRQGLEKRQGKKKGS